MQYLFYANCGKNTVQ